MPGKHQIKKKRRKKGKIWGFPSAVIFVTSPNTWFMNLNQFAICLFILHVKFASIFFKDLFYTQLINAHRKINTVHKRKNKKVWRQCLSLYSKWAPLQLSFIFANSEAWYYPQDMTSGKHFGSEGKRPFWLTMYQMWLHTIGIHLHMDDWVLQTCRSKHSHALWMWLWDTSFAYDAQMYFLNNNNKEKGEDDALPISGKSKVSRHKHRCWLKGIVGRVFCSEVLLCMECS